MMADTIRVLLTAFVVLIGIAAPVRALQMNRVATAPPHHRMLVEHAGVDLDNDGAREFLIQGDPDGALLTVHESTGDDSFALVHSLDLSEDGLFIGFVPMAAGDGDGDGLAELLVSGRIGDDGYIRVYEGLSPNAYPTELTWEISGPLGSLGLVDAWVDTDQDGIIEIVTAQETFDFQHFIGFYESNGDNSYTNVATVSAPAEVVDFQQMQVMEDLDGDGRDEVLYAALVPDSIKVHAVESVGDDAYQLVWSEDLVYEDGQPVNANTIVDAGDLDGDGRREFLCGGLKTIAQGGDPLVFVFFLYEATADNDFEIIATFSRPVDLEDYYSATVADVDGDGKREILVGSGPSVYIHENLGDNAWQEVGSITGLSHRTLGAGDHDQDGKEELVARMSNDLTGVYEIDPAEGSDLDGDSVVDAIDNCPEQSNSGQEDSDSDGAGNPCDCAPADPFAFGTPMEIANTRWLADAVTVEWDSDAPNSGTGTQYDVVRGSFDELPVDDASGMCLEENSVDTSSPDLMTPLSGSGFYYLVRGENTCGTGSYGTDSFGVPRTTIACP